MKTIVLYASKHHATEKLAQRIAQAFHTSAQPMKNHPDLNEAQTLIFGLSVYAGTVDKEACNYIKANQEIIVQKHSLLFLCGLNQEETEKVIRENLGVEFLSSFDFIDCLGGILDFSQMNFFERSIIKLINSKAQLYKEIPENRIVNLIDETKVQKFINKGKELC